MGWCFIVVDALYYFYFLGNGRGDERGDGERRWRRGRRGESGAERILRMWRIWEVVLLLERVVVRRFYGKYSAATERSKERV